MFRFMDAFSSPVTPSIQDLLDLFATALEDVRFGDVDAKTLARIATDVHAAAAVVASAQTALDRARDLLHEKQEGLLAQAHRAFAYARVYAENDAALAGLLDAIALPRSNRRAKASGDALVLSGAGAGADEALRRPRGRPRKATNGTATETTPDALLFSAK
jgi:hypothetical protein